MGSRKETLQKTSWLYMNKNSQVPCVASLNPTDALTVGRVIAGAQTSYDTREPILEKNLTCAWTVGRASVEVQSFLNTRGSIQVKSHTSAAIVGKGLARAPTGTSTRGLTARRK